MSRLVATLRRRGSLAAVSDGLVELDATMLLERAERLAESLGSADGPVGLALPNGVDWVVADLALVLAGRPCVPLPAWFGPPQVRHVARTVGLTEWLGTGAPPLAHEPLASPLPGVTRAQLDGRGPALPARCGKVTFTSGTTGAPKGVCLGQSELEQVAESVAAAGREAGVQRHLCVLPLPVLLENVAGAWAALLAGATCELPRLETLGLTGADGVDAGRFARAVARHDPESLILVPALLEALVGAIEAGAPRPRGLRLVAVGGARVPSGLLARATRLGLPVYEGYGLSECGSVVSLNHPWSHGAGTAGEPLPHARVSIAADGEILVDGPLMLGYAGESGAVPRPWPTGDLGRLDASGRLIIDGRKRNVFITAMGRNLSPEWIEAELVSEQAIGQAAVFGEGLPAPVAVLVCHEAAAAGPAVARVNQRLPGHARLAAWIVAEEPFVAGNGLATANGRVLREAVWRRYGLHFASLTEELRRELL